MLIVELRAFLGGLTMPGITKSSEKNTNFLQISPYARVALESKLNKQKFPTNNTSHSQL